IIGAVLAVVGPSGLRASAIASKAMLPLLASPLIAIILCWALLLLGKMVARRVPAWRPGCCAQDEWRKNPFICDPSRPVMPEEPKRNHIERLLSLLHWLSSGATSFARGLNDVPKIAAFLLLGFSLYPGAMPATSPASLPVIMVAIAMGLGSLWGGYRVLSVMAHRIAPLARHNAVVANVTTSGLVLLASPLGLPMSTTHVSTGALFGVRLGERSAPPEKDAIKTVLLGWLVTLPVAAALAAAGGWLLRAL
ncbi:MAG: inorganic phosphate transporter, partial [Gammaproteobacteria bacterium]|nr:inorganic phosphate transporter [Gammaproteobacteria bacterium]